MSSCAHTQNQTHVNIPNWKKYSFDEFNYILKIQKYTRNETETLAAILPEHENVCVPCRSAILFNIFFFYISFTWIWFHLLLRFLLNFFFHLLVVVVVVHSSSLTCKLVNSIKNVLLMFKKNQLEFPIVRRGECVCRCVCIVLSCTMR